MKYMFLSLISLLISNAHSEEKYFEDWMVDSIEADGDVMSFANTSNESESILGVMCISDGHECQPYFINGLSCDEDGDYPALVSVDEGITFVNMGCWHFNKKTHIYTLPANHMEYIITGKKYGIAFGTESGKFKAAYFSLNGSAKAIIAARAALGAATSEQPSQRKSKVYADEVL